VLVGVVSSSSRGVDVGLGIGVFVVASPAITVCRVGAGVVVTITSVGVGVGVLTGGVGALHTITLRKIPIIRVSTAIARYRCLLYALIGIIL
jgi:hypothetical protein